ncbi:DUF4114 domain-containing protein [Flavobacterium rhizosphaerae]|uniref:DUF4114 domain-containing protein n=1 Tax=Flavobacterium rhizosphaerae TaxID=3163298 RepID=A0ABW8YZX7_9FLAO
MKRVILLTALLFSTLIFSQNYQFLGSYNQLGVPDYLLENDEVSPATMAMIANALPEGYPVPQYNPHYITSGYDTDIELLSAADVYVTFVKEGAGYKNVLGYYTYNINEPLTTAPAPEDITIIFPNVSEGGSGGGLSAGNKVKIGTFPAGTGIGWVLLANGWNNTQVTQGLWQLFSNPNFNPEANPDLRHHNVLLADPDNERVLLGFEDIRRDYSSCDNDFNDAIFYITSNPYSAMSLRNMPDVETATDVSSGNDGGLESNGDLASLIAKRNFKRTQSNSFLNKKQLQSPFLTSGAGYKMNNEGTSLQGYFPTTGMFGTETTYLSTPTDLLGITNAEDVFSVDYYSGESRVAAALVTQTSGAVYNHSKVICDRLNGSSLEDVRTVTLQGHEIILAKLKRANGLIEYALSFSVSQQATQNILHSYWNIEQFPQTNYLNFQAWGANMGQVCTIVNYILNQLDNENPLVSTTVENRIPTVFVKSGTYKNGLLNLEVVNKSAASILEFEGNKKATEFSQPQSFTQQIALTTDYDQTITIDTQGIFDIGLSVHADTSLREDGLYLADGPWGIDYNEQQTTVSSFTIGEYIPQTSNEGEYIIERDASVTGQLFGTMNLFRNILAGELVKDVSGYEALNFTIANSHNVEVVLITEGLTNWEERLRFQIQANVTNTAFSIPLSSFTNPAGGSFEGQNVKGIVFSVMGSYSTFEPFFVNASAVSFGVSTLSNNTVERDIVTKMYNYPNPFTNTTTVVLPGMSAQVTVQLIDMAGRVLLNNTYTPDASNSINVEAAGLPKGLYIINAYTDSGKSYTSKCMVK